MYLLTKLIKKKVDKVSIKFKEKFGGGSDLGTFGNIS